MHGEKLCLWSWLEKSLDIVSSDLGSIWRPFAAEPFLCHSLSRFPRVQIFSSSNSLGNKQQEMQTNNCHIFQSWAFSGNVSPLLDPGTTGWKNMNFFTKPFDGEHFYKKHFVQILSFLCGTLTFPLAHEEYMCLRLVYVYLCICLDFEINSYGRPPFQPQIPSLIPS